MRAPRANMGEEERGSAARSTLTMQARVHELLAAARAQTPNARMRVRVGVLLESASG
jgi:hypothetical protein